MSPARHTNQSVPMRHLNYILAVLVIPGIAFGVYLYWLFMTPVTADNVQTRLTNYCHLGTKALQINENSKLVLEQLPRGSCGCLADKLVSDANPTTAATLTDGARRLGIFGLRRKLGSEKGGGGLLSKSGLSDNLIAEFAERYVRAANACMAGAI
jgi:hypothetical protein